MSKGRRRHWA